MLRMITSSRDQRPDPEVPAKPRRRRHTAEYKRRILTELDACDPGQQSAVIRREGLYSSHVSNWRRQRKDGELGAAAALGRPPKDPLRVEVDRLERENERLREKLRKADLIIEVQKKIALLLDLHQASKLEPSREKQK